MSESIHVYKYVTLIETIPNISQKKIYEYFEDITKPIEYN